MSISKDPLRDPLNQIFVQILKGKELYESTIKNYQALQGEKPPTAKNPDFQIELNIVHATYLKAIPFAIASLKKQSEFGQKYAPAITEQMRREPLDLDAIRSLDATLQAEFAPIHQQQQKMEAVMGLLTHRIVQLMTENDPPTVETGYWERLAASLI